MKRPYLQTRTAAEIAPCDVAGCPYPSAVCAITDSGFPWRWYCGAHASKLCADEHPRLQHGERCVGCGGLG